MGDLASPNRLAVVADRLRRRFETYKRDSKSSFTRYACNSVRLYETQRQETQLTHQKWLESRAKKATKNVRVSRETAPGPQVQPKIKRTKVDATDSTGTTITDVTNVNDPRQQETTTSSNQTSVSVNIEQIIKAPQSTGSQIEINLKSIVHTGKGDNSTTEISTSTNICKEEPKDVRDTSNPSSNDSLSIGLDDVDELQEILDALEKEPDLIKELDPDLKTVDSDVLNEDKKPKSDDQMFTSSKGFCQTEGSMFSENSSHLKGTGEQTPGSSTGYGRVGAALPGSQTQMPSFGDAGPAAKTLQQMAAQHQSHQDYIDKVNIGHNYGNDGFVGERSPVQNFNGQQSQGYMPQQSRNGSYDYNQHMGNLPMYRGSLSDSKMESMNVMSYGAETASTRPLSHFDSSSVGISTPSAAQHPQHQKPVFSESAATSDIQFSQSGKLNATPNENMQFSQSQQVVINSNGVPVSTSQSQSFGIGEVTRQNIPSAHTVRDSSNQPDACMSEQMKLQMYQKKLMQDQHIRNQLHNQRPGQFPVHTNSQRFQNPNIVSTSTADINSPLQTMQNMVAQTNQRHPVPVYGAGKSGNLPGCANPHNTSSSTLGPGGSQSQTVYPGTVANSTAGKMDNTGFTSSLMRGHRPPNVNVGPDGLNISQPRINNWRQASAHRSVDSHQMPQCQGYNRHVAPSLPMYRMHMSQQQNMHMAPHHRQLQYMNPTPHTVPRPGFMMHQQQHMQMANGNPMMGTTQPTTHTQGMSAISHANHPHFPDFMESSHHSSDLFESVHNGNPSDYNLIDDILNGK